MILWFEDVKDEDAKRIPGLGKVLKKLILNGFDLTTGCSDTIYNSV